MAPTMNTTPIGIANDEFAYSKTASGVSHNALSDIRRIRSGKLAPPTARRRVASAQTPTAPVMDTTRTRPAAERNKPPQETGKGSANRHTCQATIPAASNPPIGGNHFGFSSRAEVSIRLREFTATLRETNEELGPLAASLCLPLSVWTPRRLGRFRSRPQRSRPSYLDESRLRNSRLDRI